MTSESYLILHPMSLNYLKLSLYHQKLLHTASVWKCLWWKYKYNSWTFADVIYIHKNTKPDFLHQIQLFYSQTDDSVPVLSDPSHCAVFIRIPFTACKVTQGFRVIGLLGLNDRGISEWITIFKFTKQINFSYGAEILTLWRVWHDSVHHSVYTHGLLQTNNNTF